MLNREEVIADIAKAVIERLRVVPAQEPAPPAPQPAAAPPRISTGDGVFETVDEAVAAASEAQKRVAAMSLEDRGRMIAIIRQVCEQRSHQLARMELDETGLGRLDHKIEKLKAVKYVLGVEAMQSGARSDASGLCVIEHAPFGVIGMVLPATHSAPTMASNAINVLAGGNTAVFSPHPAGAGVAAYALQVFNHESIRFSISRALNRFELYTLLLSSTGARLKRSRISPIRLSASFSSGPFR